jgi:hypothetical protein
MISGRRWASVVAVLLLALQTVLLSWAVFHRRINPDEGIYLTSSYRLATGQLPYRDFMYPQMPNFAYLFAPLVLLGVPLLVSARFVSVACSGALSTVLYREMGRRGLPDLARIVLLALFVLHGLKLISHATAVTHAPSDLLALLSFTALERRRPLLSGIFLGLAVGFRLPLAPLVLVYAGALWWRGQPRGMIPLAVGFALALTPVLPLVAIDPANFAFGTYTLHQIRGNFPNMAASLRQKGAVLLKWLLFPQDLLVLLITLSARRQLPALPAIAVLVLGAAFLQATPTYLGYVVQVLPFLFIAAGPGFAGLVRHRKLLAAVMIAYVLSAVPSLGYSPISIFSEGPQEKNRLWNPGAVNAVVRLIRAHSAPGDHVLSWWEGYPTLADRDGVIGVGFWEASVARKLGDPKAARFHCMTLPRIGALITRRDPAVIVVPTGIWTEFLPQIEQGYEPVGAVGTVHLYARRPSYLISR